VQKLSGFAKKQGYLKVIWRGYLVSRFSRFKNTKVETTEYRQVAFTKWHKFSMPHQVIFFADIGLTPEKGEVNTTQIVLLEMNKRYLGKQNAKTRAAFVRKFTRMLDEL